VKPRADIDLVEEHVEVAVDQPGHERAAAQVDAGGGGRLDRPIGNVLDALAFDQDLDPVHEFAAARIEEASAGKQEGGHGEACGRTTFWAKRSLLPNRNPESRRARHGLLSFVRQRSGVE